MTTKDFFEKVIKEHIKERDDIYHNIKGLKVLDIETDEAEQTLFKKSTGDEYQTLTKYIVKCSMKARKYENNRVFFKVYIWDDVESEIGVFYEGDAYEG
jgi:hypothetical protein